MERHLIIEAVEPCVDGGRYAAKRIVGEPCRVEADIFRDGHAVLRAVVKWRRKTPRRNPGQESPEFIEAAYAETPLRPLVNDRWRGEFPLCATARYGFTIEAWTDGYASWLFDLQRRVEGGYPDVASEVVEGIALLQEALAVAGDEGALLHRAVEALHAARHDPAAVLALAAEEALGEAMLRLQPRRDAVRYEPELEVIADRPRARFGAWYEMFVRSQGSDPARGATFREAEARLRDIRDMGFDVLYLAPIHPIGRSKRKGPNNTLRSDASHPGSPWAIGSEHGGHTAIEPALGTLEDFDHFVAAARQCGLEVALDFAIQCSPDHPWVTEHPEWFYHRPDGTIKYAENPPKKYEDIYPVNFDTDDRWGLWHALRDVLLFWIERQVRIFRVDNPHTKPLVFWEWLIPEIQADHPDVIFLSEAFTRPKMMKLLAKAGFTQSYTYFTWRNEKWDLTEYLTELTTSGMQEYFRPNFFTNTPDILQAVLQKGGRPAFMMRFVLAATLSPSYGIYSGFELGENTPLREGSEEYLDSEKYQIRVRDWNQPGNIKELMARVNIIRRENPALHDLTNLRFFETDNEQLLFYAKMTADRSNVILVLVNLDPAHPHHGTAMVPLEEIGVPPGARYEVCDLLSGARYEWSERNYVRLDPQVQPAHIFRVERHLP
ncbi:MAG: alpha-1,4-glucan--maltose-1-phosphate maltosyltransferase [Candidatus Tectomicrobia bacterium]|nr:alpha-1,4-glucan--maltose-1-phosphate maltosyltransferase [Candidatus Tectomicrobia bacterium]